MFQTIEECRLAWENAGRHGGTEERIQRNMRWAAYYQHLANEQSDGDASVDTHAVSIADLLQSEGFLHANATVLDIGAGMGRYALAFAETGARVTALDMDAASLDVLERQSARLGLSVQIAHGMWETYAPKRSFSLVFSAMCPAICDYDELMKMEALSENACCLIAVTRGSYDLHRKKLMALLSAKPSGMTTEAIWYYNMLYVMGRQPDVKNFATHAAYRISIEDACHRNEIYFQIFGIGAAESRPVLQQYFKSVAVDGLVYDETHLNTAMITWKVPRENT